jgi:hypothetical protein
MKQIEKQRDEAEEERIKELIRKLNEECEIALQKQWEDAEELKLRQMNELKDEMRNQAQDLVKLDQEKATRDALYKAELEFKKRELETIDRIKRECESEFRNRVSDLCKSYDSSIEALLAK